jgi:hypothetical protein
MADTLDPMIHLGGLHQLDRDQGVTAYSKPDLELRCVCRWGADRERDPATVSFWILLVLGSAAGSVKFQKAIYQQLPP